MAKRHYYRYIGYEYYNYLFERTVIDEVKGHIYKCLTDEQVKHYRECGEVLEPVEEKESKDD